MAYTVEWLREVGPRYLLALILEKLETMDEPFVTYGEVAKMLARELDIPNVFSTHPGGVAGSMMDRILEVDENAPPINALVTRASGIPGEGFAGYYDDLWRKSGGRRWLELPPKRMIEVVKEVREAVRDYDGWDDLFEEAFGDRPGPLDSKVFTEEDGKPPEAAFPRGRGESEQHRRLKEWACANPRALGLGAGFQGFAEQIILSGDRIDVLFRRGAEFVVVEVKSALSSDDDLQRGIYQCVKYRAVLEATAMPVDTKVLAILLSEENLPPRLVQRARILGVVLKVHKING